MAVGTYFGPKVVVVTFARSTPKAGKPDDGQIEPPKTLAVGGMSELMHTELVAQNKTFVMTWQRVPKPQVDKRA